VRGDPLHMNPDLIRHFAVARRKANQLEFAASAATRIRPIFDPVFLPPLWRTSPQLIIVCFASDAAQISICISSELGPRLSSLNPIPRHVLLRIEIAPAMSTSTILIALTVVWAIPPAAADSGDDSSNNLFSDLAPYANTH
jgi:hypothetical protein